MTLILQKTNCSQPGKPLSGLGSGSVKLKKLPCRHRPDGEKAMSLICGWMEALINIYRLAVCFARFSAQKRQRSMHSVGY